MSAPRPSVVILAGPNGTGKTMRPAPQNNIDRIFREDCPRIDEALKQGVRDAMIRHKKDGLPVVIYRDGKAVEMKPEHLGF